MLRYAGAVRPKFLTMDPIKKRKMRLEELEEACHYSEIKYIRPKDWLKTH